MKVRRIIHKNLIYLQYTHIFISFLVIDDENTNVVTAGAIVTVTVSLVRQNMSELFGDTTAVEKEEIKWV